MKPVAGFLSESTSPIKSRKRGIGVDLVMHRVHGVLLLYQARGWGAKPEEKQPLTTEMAASFVHVTK